MRQLIVLLATVTVVWCAETGQELNKNEQDVHELRSLLEAVEHYLDKKNPEPRAESGQQRTVYKHKTKEEVDKALADGSGYWTGWINVDKFSGTGEFEDCDRIRYEQNKQRRCLLGCENPDAWTYALVSGGNWQEIEQCVGPMDDKRVGKCGFNCHNLDAQKVDKSKCVKARCEQNGIGTDCDQCPDVQVKFFCTGKPPRDDICCPYSNDCQKYRKLALRASLQQLQDTESRRDVLAGILHDVRSILDEGDVEKNAGEKTKSDGSETEDSSEHEKEGVRSPRSEENPSHEKKKDKKDSLERLLRRLLNEEKKLN